MILRAKADEREKKSEYYLFPYLEALWSGLWEVVSQT